MSPIQQMLLGVGAVATKTYVDDVFSTYVYKGTGSSLSINNGIDVSGEGALVWLKSRSNSYGHKLTDTVRGSTKQLNSDAAAAQSTSSDFISGFTSTGFTLGTDVDINSSSHTYTSWTFRKTPGFFDVVTYTGNETALRNISHSLGCEPGLILIKRTDSTGNWWVYHRDLGDTDSNYSKAIKLNNSGAIFDDYKIGNRSKNTSTTFMVGNDPQVNGTGTYVAYLFAGGESTAATARSVDFDATGDYLSLASSADFSMGTGDYTIEAWFKATAQTSEAIWTLGDYTNGQELFYKSNGSIGIYANGWIIDSDTNYINIGQWYHSAVVRDSGTVKLYINGELIGSASQSGNMPSNGNGPFYVGAEYGDGMVGNFWPGKISNLRVVKGTAVYTSSFRPPTAPLTNITNTKLLCCNNSSTTGSTVTPGTITANGDPTASTDSPFDDPAGFVFGENEDQNVIKCGSYIGNGSSTGPEINLGFESQWILVKSAGSTEHWEIYDSIRGIVTGDTEPCLEANLNNAESENNRFSLTPTGFKIVTGSGSVNSNGTTYIYLCIRRPDGYVGKPADAGTDVFDIEFGSGGSANPAFIGGFPVDFGISRELYQSGTTNPAGAGNYTGVRLTGQTWLATHDNSSEQTGVTDWIFDSNTGWAKNYPNNYISWMWKRHTGFDVVTYTGNGTAGLQISHSLSKSPEMIWVKDRENTRDWRVFHHGLNGGSNPAQYGIKINSDEAESQNSSYWNDTAPTSTSFTIGTSNNTNNSSTDYIAMLFASTDVSKVGSYDGDSSNNISLTLGFTPRLLIIKSTTTNTGWVVMDSLRDSYAKQLQLNSTAAQNTDSNYLIVSMNSTTTVLEPNKPDTSASGEKYIYYAHA